MKIIVTILLLLSLNGLYAQSPDLIINTTITPEYVSYLETELLACDDIIFIPPSDTALMKAYAKRIFINISLMHYRYDSSLHKRDAIRDSLDVANTRIDDFYNVNIKPLPLDDSKLFFEELLELFKDPRYSELKDELERISESYASSLNDFGMESMDVLMFTVGKVSQVINDFDELRYNEIPFTVRIEAHGNGFLETMDFHETHFHQIERIHTLFSSSLESFVIASERLGMFQNGDISSDSVIQSLKLSMDYFTKALDSLSLFLNSPPLDLLALNTTWIDDTKNTCNEVTGLLNGNRYTIGDDSITIRPIALLENPIQDWEVIFLDYYRTSDRASYTFGNLFPEALPVSVMNQLNEDMVINGSDTEEDMKARMMTMKGAFLDSISQGKVTSSNVFGAALTQTFFYMFDLQQEIADLTNYIDRGDFREPFHFQVLNNTSLTDSITTYFNMACTDDQMMFTMLMITEEQTLPYTVDATSKIVPFYFSYDMAVNLKKVALDLHEAQQEIQSTIRSLDEEMNLMFNLSLDPNHLDFSNVHSPLDFILVLESSNPDFLDMTAYGISKLQDARSHLREGLSELADFTGNMHNMLDSLAVYRSEYEVKESEFYDRITEFNNFIQELNNDFQFPDSTTYIDNERVNFSAWFDNPPQDMLQKMKYFFDEDSTTDNTMGGFFPDGRFVVDVPFQDQLPTGYSVSQNYPNPFNPTTTIEYQVAIQSYVTLTIFDVLGREVKTLLSQEMSAGRYNVSWNAENIGGGVYYYRFTAGSYSETKRLILVK